jgi:very-short-patch-repair endonuclease
LNGAPNTWLQRLMAALLAAGPRAWTSHHSSAALHHLAGYAPDCIELTTMHNRRRIDGAILHKTNRYPPFFPIQVEGLTTADVNLTLLDLAAVDPIERVEEAMEDAIARRITSVRKVEWFLTRAAGRGVQGSTVLKKLLDYRLPREEVPQSVMESRMDRMIRRGKLPRPIRQFSLRNESGREVARPDFAYPARKLGIECQSYRWHFGRRKWHHDLARSNELTRLGWRILYFTWDQIENEPDAVIERIRGELGYLTLG